jgi:hypothetical protein
MNSYTIGRKRLSILFMLNLISECSGIQASFTYTVFHGYVVLCDKFKQKTVLSAVILSCIMLMLFATSCLKNTICNVKFFQKIGLFWMFHATLPRNIYFPWLKFWWGFKQTTEYITLYHCMVCHLLSFTLQCHFHVICLQLGFWLQIFLCNCSHLSTLVLTKVAFLVNIFWYKTGWELF